MRIRFKIYFDVEPMTLGISIQATPREMNQLAADLGTIHDDYLQQPTEDFIEALKVMTGQTDFTYDKN